MALALYLILFPLIKNYYFSLGCITHAHEIILWLLSDLDVLNVFESKDDVFLSAYKNVDVIARIYIGIYLDFEAISLKTAIHFACYHQRIRNTKMLASFLFLLGIVPTSTSSANLSRKIYMSYTCSQDHRVYRKLKLWFINEQRVARFCLSAGSSPGITWPLNHDAFIHWIPAVSHSPLRWWQICLHIMRLGKYTV